MLVVLSNLWFLPHGGNCDDSRMFADVAAVSLARTYVLTQLQFRITDRGAEVFGTFQKHFRSSSLVLGSSAPDCELH